MTTDNQSLPPLPEPDGELTIRIIGRDCVVDSYRHSTMCEYGDARAAHARKQALEEAEKVCEDLADDWGDCAEESGMYRCSEAIKELK